MKKRQKPSTANYPVGTIGVLSSDLSRYVVFQQCLRALQFPPGSQILWCRSLWIAGAVNQIIARMRPEDAWLTLLADDHTFSADMLFRLLDHQLPIVAPLVFLRQAPYAPSLFHAVHGDYEPYTWDELDGKTGLLPVDTCGGPLAVIRREVLDALGPPWFQCKPGELEFPKEDLYFFDRARQAGFQPYVDLDCPIGHCFPGVMTPARLADGTYALHAQGTDPLGLLALERRQGSTALYHAYT